MYEIAKLPSEEREILFQNAAARKGMNAAIIEKDFWVCLTLLSFNSFSTKNYTNNKFSA